jgi:hypothetical protein
MVGELKIETGMAAAERVLPRRLRTHAFVSLAVAGVLLGGALRFIPTSTAAVPGQGASTACAAK